MTIITDDNFNRKAPLKTKAQEVKETMSMSISARIYCERHRRLSLPALLLVTVVSVLAITLSSPAFAQEGTPSQEEKGTLKGATSSSTAAKDDYAAPQAPTTDDCVEPGYDCSPDGTYSLTFSSTSPVCTWNVNFNWGDGNSDTFSAPGGTSKTVTHTYTQPGLYTINGSWTGTSSDPNITCTPGSAQFKVEVPVDRPDTFINTPPAPPSGSTVKSKDATFTYTSDKSPVTFECSLDGSPFSDCTSQPKKYTNLADGQHTFQVRAKDADGHEDRTPATRTWKIDATPPETTITSGPPAVLTNSFTAKFGFTSNEAESTFQCSLDNGPYGSCTSPKTYTGLSVGNHTFRVKATDKAGNVDPTPAVRSFQVRWVVFIGGKSYTCTKVGTQGNDVLTGTAGNDVICGLGGNDTLRGLGGNDVLIGGDGVDTASYQGTTTGVNASLTTNTATGQGSDRFLQIENLTGSDGNDVLTGSAGPNVLIGLKGADRMFGLGGNDTINSKDGVIRNDTLDGGTGTDTKITDATEAKIVGFP